MSDLTNYNNRIIKPSTGQSARDALSKLGSRANTLNEGNIATVANRIVEKTSRNLEAAKKNPIKIIFIIDKSGSMKDNTCDVSTGFNTIVENQKNFVTEITTYLFDHEYEKVHSHVPAKSRPKLALKALGGTALYDSMVEILNLEKNCMDNKTVVVLCTDGEDEHSDRYSLSDARNLISYCQKMGTKFLVLGAGDIDARGVAEMFGIDTNNAISHTKDGSGYRAAFESINNAVNGLRLTGFIPSDWSSPVDADNKKRLESGYTRKLIGGR